VDEQSLQTLLAERDALKQRCERLEALLANVGYPPGHFYSPIVDVSDRHAIHAVRHRLEAPPSPGITIDEPAMNSMMERLAEHHRLFPFPRNQTAGFRFYFDNPFFGCYDASILFSMVLEIKPHRIIEVGCGHSSCLLLDTNERFFDGALDLTLIDPSLDNLKQLFGDGGASDACLINSPVQDVAKEVFEKLEENDILFLDSSHVSKTGSDVNYLLFEILPALKPGVLVHVHDILYPFEYPEDWVLKERRSWNESYLLRAFLQYNSAFEIVYWNNFAWHQMHENLGQLMPLSLENEGGSIWLRRVR
jgi:Methyltransferase domain